ncbi:beta-lactamase class A [Clostridium amylolyticum]|uniref:Beta-lactamase class A n=1 Tax=Clostridium amylolyticum TaxID=1121298 RepID=A0A1M6KVX9_9CLOT|nr:serine hydrolase [Clostridium amylolyticum]SHJ63127.1 beta-lactamase class A [Clostridium amylolyticum]
MKEIKKYFESRIGNYSFYFEDLNSGFVYGYNENVKMTAAGCMKLPIAIALLKEVENLNFNLNDKILIGQEDKVYGTGILHEFLEREYTLYELMVAMLIQSDNTASNKIINLVGKEKINESIREMGLKNTVLNRRTSDEIYDDNNDENITTSYDLCKCWKILFEKKYLNQELSDMLIDILKRQQLKNKSALYIPDDLKSNISNKTGDKKAVENDTMFINIEKGTFAFSVMSNEIPNSVYGIVTIAKAGKMMWDNITNYWS